MAKQPKLDTHNSAEIEKVAGAGFSRIYANVTQIGMGPWDIQLSFGQLVTSDQLSSSVEQQVTVVVSPQQAKSMAVMLNQALADYERQYGEIKLPEALLQPTGGT